MKKLPQDNKYVEYKNHIYYNKLYQLGEKTQVTGSFVMVEKNNDKYINRYETELPTEISAYGATWRKDGYTVKEFSSKKPTPWAINTVCVRFYTPGKKLHCHPELITNGSFPVWRNTLDEFINLEIIEWAFNHDIDLTKPTVEDMMLFELEWN